MTDTATLFEPLAVKQVTLRNRIVMSPMTRRFSPGGIPTEEVASYYLRRVHGGVGLIVTEGVGIDHPAALDDSGIPVMYGPASRFTARTAICRTLSCGAARTSAATDMVATLRKEPYSFRK